jgi:hypothetical protein
MFAQQLKTALAAAWLVVSAALLPVLVAPFVLPADTIFELAPICEARAQGGECAFCGMTHAFVMIGHGLPDEAWAENGASLPLFSVLLWNECVAFWFALTAFVRRLPRRSIRVVFRTREEARACVETEETSCKS